MCCLRLIGVCSLGVFGVLLWFVICCLRVLSWFRCVVCYCCCLLGLVFSVLLMGLGLGCRLLLDFVGVVVICLV